MAEKQQQKENPSFFGGAAILAAGILMVKIIGIIYKVPLVGLLGDGYTDFGIAFNVFNVLLMVSTAGVPVAISKMVSEAKAKGQRKQIHKIFRVSFLFFFAVGTLSSAVMFFGADRFAALMNDTKAADCMRALAPSVMLVSGLSACRGYAQGHLHMTPSSISQIMESVFKLIIGLPLAWYLINVLQKPDHIGAAGAIVGVTISEFIALTYMIVEHRRFRPREPRGTSKETQSSLTILKSCLALAIPITLTSASTSIITLMDNALVMNRLQFAGRMLSEDGARNLMSNYTGVQTIYQIPPALMVAITASVIPAVTTCFTKRDKKGASRIVGSALKTAALIAFPSGVGMMVLGTPIVRLMFKGLDPQIAGPILSILGIANVFVCLMLVCNSILQSHGILNLPIFTMLAGGVVMVLFDFFMVGTKQFHIFGSPIGTVICYAITCSLNLFIVYRIVPGCPSFTKVFGKITIASLLMGGGVWGVYGLLEPMLGNALALILSVGVGMVIFFALIVLLRVLNQDDLALMPKGDKIGRLLRIK